MPALRDAPLAKPSLRAAPSLAPAFGVCGDFSMEAEITDHVWSLEEIVGLLP